MRQDSMAPDPRHVVRIPTPADSARVLTASIDIPTDVFNEVGVEELVVYWALRRWTARGAEITFETVTRELNFAVRAEHPWPLHNLIDRGLLVTADTRILASYRRNREPIEEIESVDRSQAPPRTRKGKRAQVPDPFPAFGEGRWDGTRDDLINTCPRPGVSVVYHLFDDERLLYVGSTINVYGRFPGHDRKPWTRFEAFEAPNEEAARWLEARDILELVPPLNSPHDTVSGRVQAIAAAR